MSKILIIAEHNGTELNNATAKCVSCAAATEGSIHILVLAADGAAVAAQAAGIAGVEEVISINHANFAQVLAATQAPEIAAIAADYSHIYGPSSTFGRDLMPRVAALLGVNQVADIMSVKGPRSFQRPVYAGNAIIDVSVPEGMTIVATIRMASWAAAEGGNSAAVSKREASAETPTHSRYIGLKTEGGDLPDLQSANRVIAGGRGLGSEENFQLIYQLASKLGAGVGASRAAVDAGYVPNDMQVGQTGKIISPDLYMAFGISGAIQHVTGIKDAGTIVAINKDAEAPIFEVADIGLVGDLFSIIPEIEAAI
ncbi:MAG: electron transfer flavoprotein subunit alpha/FixB family protein [Proteobacteria bacterium]|nr:electron transfer flavoprotein subunit alpha/FixB family protein [Pseudomonadota bacterium]